MNHTITTEQIERLRDLIERIRVNAEGALQSTDSRHISTSLTLIAEDALAAFDSTLSHGSEQGEPVAWAIETGPNEWIYTSQSGKAEEHRLIGTDVVPLYTKPSAAMSVPDEITWRDAPKNLKGAEKVAYAFGYNTCRDALFDRIYLRKNK